MKKFLTIFALAVLTGIALVACSDDKDEPVSSTALPQTAQSFISSYFSTHKILKVEKDIENGKTTYDVRFTSGYEVEFDEAGQWLDVDAPKGQTIPDGIAPQPIVSYAATTYPGDGINEISRKSYGFDVELVSGIDLVFDADGNFVRAEQ